MSDGTGWSDEYQERHPRVHRPHGAAVGDVAAARVEAADPRRSRRQGRARARPRRRTVVDPCSRQRGARAVGLDNSARQLEHARLLIAEAGVEMRLVHAARRGGAAAGRLIRRRLLRPRRDDVRRPLPGGARGGSAAPAGRSVRVLPPDAARDVLLERGDADDRSPARHAVLRNAPFRGVAGRAGRVPTCRTASGSASSASMVCVSRPSSRCGRRKARNRRTGRRRRRSGRATGRWRRSGGATRPGSVSAPPASA